jgi:hypothetical protein
VNKAVSYIIILLASMTFACANATEICISAQLPTSAKCQFEDAAAVSADETPVTQPIAAGYYRIVSAGNGTGYSDGPYNYEYKYALYNKDGYVYWAAYDSYDYGMVYQLIQDGEDWLIYNPSDNTYIGKATATFNCNVATSSDPVKQSIGVTENGKFTIQNTGNDYVFSLSNNHNGSAESSGSLNVWGSAQEASKYGINLWYMEAVPANYVDVLKSNGKTKDISEAIQTYGTLGTDITTSSDPGFHNIEAVDNYNAALAKAQALTGTEEQSQIQNTLANLQAAYNQALPANPIKAGFYYIVTAGNGSGYSGGPYNYEGKSALYNESDLVKWKPFDPTDLNQVYYLSDAANGNWNVYSVMDQSYINKGAKSYHTSISTTTTPTTPQTFTQTSEGKFCFNFADNPYVYSVAAGHNGTSDTDGDLDIWGTPEEAKKYGVNVWYIKTVSDSQLDELLSTQKGALAKCLDYENTLGSMTTGTAPGYYLKETLQSFETKIDEAKTTLADSLLTDDQRNETLTALEEEYQKANKTIPITDGYYFILNTNENYIKKRGNKAAIYTAPNCQVSKDRSACLYNTLDKNNANYIFKITKEQNGYSIENAYTHWYLDIAAKTSDILNCTKEQCSLQNFTWHESGSFFISDSTNCNSIALSDTDSYKRQKLVTTEFMTTTASNANTWTLLPVEQDEVEKLIASQKITDAKAEEAFSRMVSYKDSAEIAYQNITDSAGTKYDVEAVAELKSKYNIVDKYIQSRSYDITTTATGYESATNELKAALEDAKNSIVDDTTDSLLQGTPLGAVSVDYTTNLSSTTVNTPSEVFDNDYTTFYAAYERSVGYVGLDLGKQYVITRVAYAPRKNWAARLVLGVFEGANKPDFSDAVPFYVIKDTPEYNKMTYAKVNCSRGFRYVRYVGPNDARCNISELKFYGKEGCGDNTRLYQLTNLPLVVIRTTENVSEVSSRTTWLQGHINIISEDGTALKTDSMAVRGRGNGSWTFEKKPYKIKLQNKAKLLGMPAKAKEWTLINNYGDKTLIRNNVAFCLSNIFEMKYTPACTLVDVIFNGQYKGSYQLCDQIEVRKNRVDITEMTDQDNEGEALTGGYLIELDAYASEEPKYFTSSNYSIPVTVHYPKDDEITNEQFDYIQTAFNQLCASVFSSQYKTEEYGYKNYLDETSWLKYFLIEELSGNTDGYWSVYLAKDRNDVFRTYPVWDFDLAFDNDNRTHPILTMTDFLSLSSKSSAATGVRNFNRKIVESCSEELKNIWSWYRYRGNLSYEYISAVVDSLGAENIQSQEYNYTRWPIFDECVQKQYTTRDSYEAEVEYINEYLYDRIAWLDNKVGLEEPIGIHDSTKDEMRGGIHGKVGGITIRGFKDGSCIVIRNINGVTVCTKELTGFDNSVSLPRGLYIVSITDDTGATRTEKVAVR